MLKSVVMTYHFVWPDGPILTKPSLYACNFEERFHQTKKFAKLAVMALFAICVLAIYSIDVPFRPFHAF